MEIKQIKLRKMDTFCYLIGDRTSRTCALIDPAFETSRILDTAAESRYRVTHVINTHCHADHTAGNAAVIAATGATLMIHKRDAKGLMRTTNKAFARVLGGKGSPDPDVLLKDNDAIDIGDSRLTVILTPGHTPGGICLYAEGHVFTGDTLFVGGVGRTDLPGGSMQQLIDSIHERIYILPGETVVWPGHDYGLSPRSTVETEIRTNPYTGGR